MGGALKFIAGAVLIGASFAIPGIGAVAGGLLRTALLTAGFGLASSVLPSGLRNKQGIETNVADPLGSLPVVYGRAKVGMRVVDVREDPATGNKELWVVGALCHGSSGGGGVLSVDEIYFNGKLAVNAAGTVQAPFVGKLSYARLVGTDAQNFATTSVGGSTLNTKFATAWPTTSQGRGVAGLILRLTYDQEVYATGIPQVTAVVRGCLVTDVRTGGTAYSANPALCIYDYLRSTRYGMGLPSTEVDGGTTASFATMANHYDDDVTISGPGTTQDRFACHGWLDTATPPAENIRQLLTSCRGNLVYTGGLFKLFTRRSVSPTAFALTEANIVGEFRYTVPGIRETANSARAAYLAAQATDSEKPWAADHVIYPRPTDANAFLTEDNGFAVQRELELPFTADKYTAEQIAAVELQESRDLMSVELTAREEALQLEVGDVVPVTHSSPGWTAKSFWVDAVVLDPVSGLVRLGLHEYNASAYTLPGQGTFAAAPNSDLPDPSSIAAPSLITITCDETTATRLPDGRMVNRILVEWTPPNDPFLNHYLFFAGKVGGDINTYGPAVLNDTFFYIAPVPADETWQIQMIAVNQLGITSSLAPTPAAQVLTPVLNVETASDNMLVNADAQQSAIGSAAAGWTNYGGNTLQVANDFVLFGDRVLKITNGTAADSYNGQNVTVTSGEVYEFSGWVSTGGPLTGSGAGVVLHVSAVSAAFTLTLLDSVSLYGDTQASDVVLGVAKGQAQGWNFVRGIVLCNGAGTLRFLCQVGYTSTLTGTGYFDGLRLRKWNPQTSIGGRRAYGTIDADGTLYVPSAEDILVGTATGGASGSKSLTVRYPAAQMKDEGGDAGVEVILAAPGSPAVPVLRTRVQIDRNPAQNDVYRQYSCLLFLPKDVTIAAMRFNGGKSGNEADGWWTRLRLHRDTTTLITVDQANAASDATASATIGGQLVGDQQYVLGLALRIGSTQIAGGLCRCTWFEIDYTRQSLTKVY